MKTKGFTAANTISVHPYRTSKLSSIAFPSNSSAPEHHQIQKPTSASSVNASEKSGNEDHRRSSMTKQSGTKRTNEEPTDQIPEKKSSRRKKTESTKPPLDPSHTPSPGQAGTVCTTTAADLTRLVDEGLLNSEDTIKWKACYGSQFPTEDTKEVVLFTSFCERGVGIPISKFFRSVLDFYGIQLHNLNPNGIIHLAVFAHACEAFLGIEPSLLLFRYLYHVKPQPRGSKIETVGGAGIQFRQNMKDNWFDMPLKDSCGPWKSEWFVIGKYPSALIRVVYKSTWNSSLIFASIVFVWCCNREP